MIEKTVLDFLSRRVEVPVYMEVPENPPDSFVTIEKTGSGRANRVETSTLAVQSYGASMYDAAKLNDIVKTVMDDLIEDADVCASRLNSDYNYTDLETKRYRYQAVYDITHY